MSDLGPSAKGLRGQDVGVPPVVPPGAFNWATVYTFGDKENGQVKCACVSDTYIYSTSRSGVKRWDTKTGSSTDFIPSAALPGLIHAIAVVGSTIWACTGDGKVALYDVTTGELKVKTFGAHQGEVLCIAAGPENAYVLTGGIDFTIKSWQLSGVPIAAATYHRGAVECLLVTPMSPQLAVQPGSATGDGGGKGANGGGGAKVWTGSADGTVFCWPDTAGKGQLKESEGTSFLVEGGKVKSLAATEDCLWVGMEDGRIHVLRLTDGSPVKTLTKVHSGPVLAMLLVAGQMWSGSGDKTIAVHDAAPGRSPTTLFSMFDQGSYVKGLLPSGWCVWVFTGNAIKIHTSEALWLAEVARAAGALAALAEAQEKLRAAVAQIAEAREKAAWGSQEACEAKAMAEQNAAQLKALQDQLSKVQAQTDAAEKELSTTGEELEAARGAALGLRSQLADAQTALEKERKARDTTATELAEMRERLTQMEAQVQANVAELAAAQAALEREKTEWAKTGDQDQAELAAVKATLEAERTDWAKARDTAAADLVTAGAAKEELQQALDLAQKDLDTERAAAAAAQEKWRSSEEALRSELQASQAGRAADQAEVAHLQEDKERLEQQVAQLEIDLGVLRGTVDSLRGELETARTAGQQTAGSLQRQLDKAQAALVDTVSRMQASDAEVARLKTAAAANSEAAQQAAVACAALETELEEVRAQLLAAQTRCTSLSEELDGAQQRLQHTGQQLDANATELSQLTGLLENALLKSAAEEATAKQQRALLDEGAAARAALTRQLAENQVAATAAREELQSKIEALESQLAMVEVSGQEAAREREMLVRQLETAGEAVSVAEARAVAAATAADTAEQRARAAEAAVADLKKQLADGDVRAAARCDELTRRLSETERRAETAESRVQADQRELSSLRSQVSRLAAEAAAMTAAALIREKIEEELDRLRARIRDVESGLPRHAPLSPYTASPASPSMPQIHIHTGPVVGGTSLPAATLSLPPTAPGIASAPPMQGLAQPGGAGGLLTSSLSQEEQLAQKQPGVSGLGGSTGGSPYDIEMADFQRQLEALRGSSQALENLVRGLRSTLGELHEGSTQSAVASAKRPAEDSSVSKVQAAALLADVAAFQRVHDKGILELQDRAQALTEELQECRAAKTAVDNALASCQSELNDVLEDRYQLQVALRAVQRQLAEALAAAAAAEAAARAATAASVGSETSARLALLEGALRQTKFDYKTLLGEVSAIRGQLESKDGVIAQQAAELARLGPLASEAEQLRSKVTGLEMQIAGLTKQLAEADAGRRVFSDLEATHSSMQRRLAAARASDEIYSNSFAFNMAGADGGGPSTGRAGVAARDAGAKGAVGRRERERHLPPTGFL